MYDGWIRTVYRRESLFRFLPTIVICYRYGFLLCRNVPRQKFSSELDLQQERMYSVTLVDTTEIKHHNLFSRLRIKFHLTLLVL